MDDIECPYCGHPQGERLGTMMGVPVYSVEDMPADMAVMQAPNGKTAIVICLAE